MDHSQFLSRASLLSIFPECMISCVVVFDGQVHLTIVSSSSQKFVCITRGKLKLGNLHLLKAHSNAAT